MKKTALVALLLFPLTLAAGPHQKTMQDVKKEMLKLIRFAYLSPKKNKISNKEVLGAIEKTKGHIQQVRVLLANEDQRGVIATTLVHHLQHLGTSLREGHLNYAKELTRAIPPLCVSCHETDALKKSLTPEFSEKDFSSLVDYGLYNEMIRNYAKAENAYNRYLISNLSKADIFEVSRALSRQLSLQIKINNDPSKAMSFFMAYAKNKSMPQFNQHEIKDLSSLLERQAKNKTFSALELSDKEIEGQIQAFLKKAQNDETLLALGEGRLTYSILQKAIYEYLGQRGVKNSPIALYWLAKADKQLNYNMFYSLSDLYLKQCILGHPHHSYARFCFRQLKEDIYAGFTGSAGTHIPQSVLSELEELKKKVYGN